MNVQNLLEPIWGVKMGPRARTHPEVTAVFVLVVGRVSTVTVQRRIVWPMGMSCAGMERAFRLRKIPGTSVSVSRVGKLTELLRLARWMLTSAMNLSHTVRKIRK